MSHILKIAHRGFTKVFRDNTLEASISHENETMISHKEHSIETEYLISGTNKDKIKAKF